MLSTIDNPFDPFTQWDEWKRYDEDWYELDYGFNIEDCEVIGNIFEEDNNE